MTETLTLEDVRRAVRDEDGCQPDCCAFHHGGWDLLVAALAAAESERDAAREALRVIHSAVRGDEKAQHLDARAWLDARGIYNGDLDGAFENGDAVLEAVARAALAGKGGHDAK